ARHLNFRHKVDKARLPISHYFPNVFLGVLSTSVLDLIWRASLIAHVKGTKLDGEGVREGVIYYDMDRLDGPSIGAFI
ncbi:MAG: hypothetical protein ABR986_08175, partial [Methanomassiliicoccales archaeon]